MGLRAELERMERYAIEHGIPSSAFQPPADDSALARLRNAIAPMALPDDVDTLYRWHNGCSVQRLDGDGLQPIDGAIGEREIDIQELDAAPA